jgi:hypothetical protein
MRRVLVLLPLLFAALALGGCASNASTSSKKFTGPAADVDKAVGDLQTAGKRKDAAKICDELFTGDLVHKLGGAATCKDEVDKAITDSDEFTLDVRTISVNGSQATVSIRQGDKGATRTVTYSREDNRWKVASFPSTS